MAMAMATSSSPPSRLEKDFKFLLSTVTSALDKAERIALPFLINPDKLYMEEVREMVYDTEDALQDWRTETLRDQIEGAVTSTCESCRGKKRPREVRDPVPSPPHSPVPCSSCTRDKLRKLQQKYASIVIPRTDGASIEIDGWEELVTILVELPTSDPETRERYIDKGFRGAGHYCKNLTILPIHGFGGSGKTTLARHVFNDDCIQEMFGPTAWVDASNCQDDPVGLMRSVLESIGHSRLPFTQLSTAQNLLVNELKGMKFLLVIDDARSKSCDFWSSFCTREFADSVAEGSTIMITTREYEVIDAMPEYIRRTKACRTEACLLPYLILEDASSEVWRIAKEIVKKHEGILRHREGVDAWKEVLARASSYSLWMKDYRNLGRQSRRCLLYCALFPKVYSFDKKRLIKLWMSEGFVESEYGKRMEEVGDECYTRIQYMLRDPSVVQAEEILGPYLCKLNDRDGWTRFEPTPHVRYASFIVHEPKEVVEFRAPSSSLRTYIIINNTRSLAQLNLPDSAFSDLGYLRTLDLSYTNLVELPGSISHLRSLHFLGLNGTLIEALPDSLGMLYNLQTLELNSCRKLQALPKSITKLIQLRHLSLDVYLTHFCMPAGFGRLTNLQTLPIFNVGSGDEDAGLQELQELVNLRGNLFIRDLWKARSEYLQSRILKKLKFLRGLTFCFFKDWMLDCSEADGEHHKQVFENLKPHTELQNLTVQFYGGKTLPEWMQCTSLEKLRYIQLRECKNCGFLPSLGQLPSLKRLVINNVGVGVIDGHEFGTFPSLVDLTFEDMFKWKEWYVSDEMNFPKLKFLHLANCPLLARLPKLNRLETLKMVDCGCVTEVPDLTSLETLTIHNCKELITISSLTSLKLLEMKNCGKLTSLPSFPWLKKLKMENCARVTTFSSHPRLERLEMSNCTELREIPSMTSLKVLKMENCARVTTFPSYPLLETLEMSNCTELMGIPSMTSLKMLKMDSCGKVDRIPDFPSLEMLEISGCKDLIEFTSLMPLQNHDIREVDRLHVPVLMNLKVLILKSCMASIKWDKGYASKNCDSLKLEKVEFFNCLDFGDIPEISSVTSLKLENCRKKFDFSRFPKLKCLHIYDYDELDELPTLGSLSSLTVMYCGRLKRICNQPKLKDLWVESCCNQLEINQPKLEDLRVESCCNQLEIGMLPSLGSLLIANSQYDIKKPQAWLQSKNFVEEDFITSFTKDAET